MTCKTIISKKINPKTHELDFKNSKIIYKLCNWSKCREQRWIKAIYPILMGVFNFIGLKPKSMQVLSHTCLPFPKFLCQSNTLLKVSLNKLYRHIGQFWATLLSIVACWQAFDRACPKHTWSNGFNMAKLTQKN